MVVYYKINNTMKYISKSKDPKTTQMVMNDMKYAFDILIHQKRFLTSNNTFYAITITHTLAKHEKDLNFILNNNLFRYTFKLNIINDNVYLSVMFHNIEFNICNWNIDTIVSSMKSKNPNNRFITKTFVFNLLLNGKLGVKFNVSKTKDHGTLWSVKQ